MAVPTSCLRRADCLFRPWEVVGDSKERGEETGRCVGAVERHEQGPSCVDVHGKESRQIHSELFSHLGN